MMPSFRIVALIALSCVCTTLYAEVNNAPPARKLSGYAAYELKPVAVDAADAADKGRNKVNGKVQEHFDTLIAPIVAEWNAAPHDEGAPHLVIEPRVDSVRKVGGATRFFAGGFAGDSHVTMHVRFVEEPGHVVIAEPEFYQRAAALSGAWTMGAQDNDMLRRVTQIVADYMNANYASAVGGRTGRTE